MIRCVYDHRSAKDEVGVVGEKIKTGIKRSQDFIKLECSKRRKMGK
jgi:hypothetical protein